MPKCFMCSSDVSSIDQLYTHFRFRHNIDKYTSKFNCVDCPCVVTYSSWKDLRKHYVSLHNFPSKRVIDIESPQHEDCFLARSIDSPETVIENLVLSDSKEDTNVPSDESLKDLLSKCGSKLVAKVYAKPGRPRCQAQEFVDDTSEFLTTSLSLVTEIIKLKLQEENVSNTLINDISETISILKNPFKNLNSDYLRLAFLRKEGYYIKPIDFIIGSDMFSKYNKQRATWKLRHVKGTFIPLREVMRAFLELPGVLSTVLEFLESTPPNGIVSEFIHGEFWQTKKQEFIDKIVIPLFFYYDDYETDKDIGPHCAKLGAAYVKLAALPLQFQASLENIFLLSLFSSRDRVDFCNQAVFGKAIAEINFLEKTGIEVKSGTETVRVFFTVPLIVADNLGMHQMLGFAEGFTANYPCRFCHVFKIVMQTQCEEDPALLRDKVQHELDIHENNLTSTGVADRSVFEQMCGFNPTNNPSVDLLHDLWEGVAVYDINQMLYYLIIEKSYFSIEQLNVRIATFNFGDSISNKPIQLSENSIRKKSISMSGNEMRSLVRTLGHLIGDFVPEGDPVWEFYLVLRKIIDILLCRHIQQEALKVLSMLISQHHRLYISLFNDTLKPKFHFMLHYARILALSGCPLNYSCDRFESKHQHSVKDARATTSRKFIARTLAVKEQLRFAYRLMCNKGLQKDFEVGPEEDSHHNLEYLPDPFKSNEFLQHSHITLCGTKYQEDTCVVLGVDEDLSPIFGLITSILVNSHSQVTFLCNVLLTNSFSEHLHSFLVSRSSVLQYISPDDLLDYHPVLFCTGFDGKSYVTLHHAL